MGNNLNLYIYTQTTCIRSLSFLQYHKASLFLRKKKKFFNSGKRINALKNNFNLLNSYHHSHSMMDLPLQQEHLIMDIFVQELSKMLFVGMQVKLDIMYQEDLDGIVMDYQFNIKLIKLLRLKIKDR